MGLFVFWMLLFTLAIYGVARKKIEKAYILKQFSRISLRSHIDSDPKPSSILLIPINYPHNLSDPYMYYYSFLVLILKRLVNHGCDEILL